MPRLDPSSCFSGFKSGSGTVQPPQRGKSQHLACDRCRGQKLRCIRGSHHKTPCERCRKAGATCIIDAGIRMGRPRKEQPGQNNGSSRNPPRPAQSPAVPVTSSQTLASVEFVLENDAWSVHDLDDTSIDPTLQGSTVQYLDSFGFSLSAQNTLEDDSVGMPTEHYLNSTLDMSSIESIPAVTEDEHVAIDTSDPINEYNRFPYSRPAPMRQETMQELSDLNMQLSRQSGSVTPSLSAMHPSVSLIALATPPDENHTVHDAVVFMMHGLQTYHRLLVEILGSTEPTPSTTFEPRNNLKSSVETNNLISPVEGIESDSSTGVVPEATDRPRRKKPRADSNVDFTALHDSFRRADLDMPTSLLLLSCHTNLMRVCLNVFAAIRAALPAIHRQIDLFTISFLNIVDLSMPADPDLQIIVLIQSVIRMIDGIARLLGYPDGCEIESNKEGSESNARSTAIPRRLLDLVLRSEASGEGPTEKVGMRALREEIRGLHELVYKVV